VKLAILIVFLWVVLSVGTATANPIASFERLLKQADDLASASRLTSSTVDAAGNVLESPDYLAGLATLTMGKTVSVEDYALARMLRSERTISARGGNDAEGVAILWVALNDCAANNRGDMLACLTSGKGFGKQGSRKYSTARDPYDVDLALVGQVRSGQVVDPTGGATHFMHRSGFVTPTDYESVVARWAARGWSNVGLDVGTSLEVWT
jgi:hypothetical protein